jgi:hypothetical protein
MTGQFSFTTTLATVDLIINHRVSVFLIFI